jgi:pimeloyl-ACP methyl ester carboxylesterase
MQFQVESGVMTYEFVQGEGVPLLFLHGALGVRGQFQGVRGKFAERGQLLLDFPSHGESPVDFEGLSIGRLAGDVLALLDWLGIEQVDIIGYSMGGYVAIVMASKASGRVRSIVSHAMKFYWTPEAIQSTLADLDPDLLRSRSQRGFDALSAMHAECGLERTISLTRSLIADFSRWQLSEEMVRATGIPILLSAGDRDELVSLPEIVDLYGALDPKLAALMILPNTPHPFHHLPLESFEHGVRRFWAQSFRKM